MDRLLALIDHLRGRASVTTADLAGHLGVSERTVRRDLARLRDLDIEVTGEPGRRGGLRLQRGALLPALRFTQDEALVLALGLRQAQLTADPQRARAAQSAFRRLEHVLPAELGDRMEAVLQAPELREVGSWHLEHIESATFLALSEAVRAGQRLDVTYRVADGHLTRRTFDPYGLVRLANHWYLTGHCHLRGDLRTFRVDRLEVQGQTGQSFTPPPGFDAAAAVSRAVARSPAPQAVACQLWLGTSLEAVRAWLPDYRAQLREQAGGVLVTMRAEAVRFPQIALGLLAFDCPVRVLEPPELRATCARLAKQAAALARGERRAWTGATWDGQASPVASALQ